MQNPQLIIIRGSLGVGKTTIANLLSKKLDAVNFNIDQALEEVGWEQIEDENIPIEKYFEVDNYLKPRIEEALHNDKTVIIDGCFYYPEHLTHLKELTDADVKVFTLKASLETCIARDEARDKSYGKDAAEAVYNMVAKFDAGTIINTDQMDQQEVIKKISEYL